MTTGVRLALSVAIGIIAASPGARAVEAPRTLDWHRIATLEDRARLRGWRSAWVAALRKARAAGATGAIAAEGDLFDPDRSLDGSTPPPGAYRCRVFKLGGQTTAMRDWTAYPAFDCRVDRRGAVSDFAKLGGSQRPVGTIFDDTGSRSVFLGTLVLGDERRAFDYGRDQGRDMAGFVERIGTARWRMVLPWPRYESTLDVVEIVPADS